MERNPFICLKAFSLEKISPPLQANPPPDPRHFLGGFGGPSQVLEGSDHRLRLQISLFGDSGNESACKDDAFQEVGRKVKGKKWEGGKEG